MNFMRFPGGREKAVTLSYDDGVVQDRRFLEIINRYGIKCTFNLNGAYIEPYSTLANGRRMTREDAIATFCDDSGKGHEIAAHGYTHPFLEQIPVPSATYEVMKDREALEKMTGRIVRGFAYPYGAYNDQVVEILRGCGIAYARTTVSTRNFWVPSDWLRMPTTCHHNDPRLFELVDRFLTEPAAPSHRRAPKLFYLWGHTYEFDDNKNWDVIEKFCSLVGGRDDVWYATNIEIYDYTEAYRSLKFSATGDQVYNTSSHTVYFCKDGKDVTVAPGETVRI